MAGDTKRPGHRAADGWVGGTDGDQTRRLGADASEMGLVVVFVVPEHTYIICLGNSDRPSYWNMDYADFCECKRWFTGNVEPIRLFLKKKQMQSFTQLWLSSCARLQYGRRRTHVTYDCH